MTHQQIVSHLTLKYPPEVIYELSMASVISEIVRRIGEEALELSPKDLELAKSEVISALEHHMDEREYIAIGLDAFFIIRNLNS